MSEYIITIDESKADPDGGIPIKDKREVVRCCYCMYFTPGEEEPPVDWCGYFHDEVTPLGFCAWGERRGV